MNELLPCPFCGSSATAAAYKHDCPDYYYVICCDNCDVEIRSNSCNKDKDAALQYGISQWNMRVK